MKTDKASDKNPLNVEDPCKTKKDNDLRICTWNVRTLNGDGALIQLADALRYARADITALQEMRMAGQGCHKSTDCDIYYSGHANKRIYGCGFAVRRRLRHLVSNFAPISERIAAIRIKAQFFNISLICVHAPTNDKDVVAKDAFYADLEDTYDRCPTHDVKIVLGDFNGKLGRESIYCPTIGHFSLHQETNENGMRLIDFATGRNMVISSTKFQHRDIHKATWLSPDQKTKNQIDHVVIDGRHASSVLDVRTFRGVTMDSDHYLVAAKIRLRISNAKNVRPGMRKFDVAKLQSQQTAEAYNARLSELLNSTEPIPDNPGRLWEHISHSMHSAAQDTIGFARPPPKNPWFDEECRVANEEKMVAYRRSLQAAATRATWERYRELRAVERRLKQRKKRELERREREEIEMLRSRNDTRKFYQKVTRLSQGKKAGVPNCRDEHGNLVADSQSALRIWREHFSSLLQGDDDPNSANREIASAPPIELDDEVPPISYDEVNIAIMRLKNNKAVGVDGLPGELFKAGGQMLVRYMHQLLCKIWLTESMPDAWNQSVICPVLKKGDPTRCENYRGISLIAISYKVLSTILCERLKPFTNALIGPYQCGFRPGKSTNDQIFTLRQILEKTHEFQVDTHHLFVDYKAAFDSPTRECLPRIMSEFGIPAKIIRLCMMTLSNTTSSVKVGPETSAPFETVRGFRQGDPLSCDLFNLIMEAVIRRAGVETKGTIFYKSVQLLAYADDIDIIGTSKRAVTAAFSAIERESAKVGLSVNEAKTKYMHSTRRNTTRENSQIAAGRYNFDAVKEFVYLGTAINQDNNISLEIKRRIALANRCYFGLSKQLRSKALSRKTKLTLYNTLILPVLTYGAESWTVSVADAAALGVFERKILRKIFGPIRVGADFRLRMNHELYELYADIDINQRIKQQRLRWLGHVVRMEEHVPARKVFEGVVPGKRRRGAARLRWKDQVLADLSAPGPIPDWRRRAQDRSAWRQIIGRPPIT